MLVAGGWGLAGAQVPVNRQVSRAPVNRLTQPIDESRVVTLMGNVHPLARGEFDRGLVGSDTDLGRMVLVLQPTAAQQAELDALVAAQHDPQSPLYGKWLTPSEYGARFGVSPQDVARVAGWLQVHGFRVEEVPASNRLIVFSGTAAAVAEAFHVEMHSYRVNGVGHIANSQDPQVPAAFKGLVGGIVTLHDFRRNSAIAQRRALGAQGGQQARPQFTSGGQHYLFPGDFAAIYDLKSLYSAGMSGAGTSIAIVGRSNINVSDVAAFRTAAQLSANNPTVILAGVNPGLVPGDQDEATLDVEWSGGVAPEAAVKYVVGASTAATDGVDLSAEYIVNHALAPVVSTSYGSCEREMGVAELAFYNSLWQQAASQGMSAFVASGDAGAAGCNSGSDTAGSGTGVNGLCSSPYATCVGGTEFNEGSSAGQYWGPANLGGYQSALGYIPEEVWNESAANGGFGLWATGGGASVVYPAPDWQKGIGGAGAANGMRAVPDVSLSAAGHDGYIIYENGSYWIMSGTSAASPSFAAMMALVVEAKGGKGQGNANAGLYQLVNGAQNPFHSTSAGNNSVPGVTGFAATGAAYNLATGLGSVDGALLVKNWGSGAGGPNGADFALTASATAGTVQAGKSATFSVSVAESGAGTRAVALTGSGPSGIAVAVQPAVITPATAATVTVTAGSGAGAGPAQVKVTGADASGQQTLTYALTVTQPPTLALSMTAGSAAVAQGGSATANLAVQTGGSFSGVVSLSVSGLPEGISASLSANPVIPAPGVSATPLTLALGASQAATVGTSRIVVTAAGDGLTASQSIALQVQPAAGVQLGSLPASVAMQSLGSVTVKVIATPVGGVTIPAGAAGSMIGLSPGLPKGISASWSEPAVDSSGAVEWNLTLTGSAAAAGGTSTVGATARVLARNGLVYTASAAFPLTVSWTAPTLALASSASLMTVAQGSTASVQVAVSGYGSYSGPAILSASGLPAGVTASWSSDPVMLTGGSGSSTLTLLAGPGAALGSAAFSVTATASGATASRPMTVTVTQGPGVQLSLSATSLAMKRTGASGLSMAVVAMGGLSAPVTLKVNGLPAGVQASFSRANFTTAGSTSTTLSFIGSAAAKAGTSWVTVSATARDAAGRSFGASQMLALVVQ